MSTVPDVAFTEEDSTVAAYVLAAYSAAVITALVPGGMFGTSFCGCLLYRLASTLPLVRVNMAKPQETCDGPLPPIGTLARAAGESSRYWGICITTGYATPFCGMRQNVGNFAAAERVHVEAVGDVARGHADFLCVRHEQEAHNAIEEEHPHEHDAGAPQEDERGLHDLRYAGPDRFLDDNALLHAAGC